MKDTCTKRYCFCGHVQSISWKENKVLEGLFARQHSTSEVHEYTFTNRSCSEIRMLSWMYTDPEICIYFGKLCKGGSDTRVESTNVNCDLYVTNMHMDPEVKKSSFYAYVCVEKAYVHNNVCQLEPGITVG